MNLVGATTILKTPAQAANAVKASHFARSQPSKVRSSSASPSQPGPPKPDGRASRSTAARGEVSAAWASPMPRSAFGAEKASPEFG